MPLCVDQVLSYIAKGSFGPILKVKDKAKQKTYAVKVSPLHQSCVIRLRGSDINRVLTITFKKNETREVQ